MHSFFFIIRRTLLRLVISLLIVTSCYFAFKAREYSSVLSTMMKHILGLSLVTVLEFNETVSMHKEIEYDDTMVQKLHLEASFFQNESKHDFHRAYLLQARAKELKEQVTYMTTSLIPAVVHNMTQRDAEWGDWQQTSQPTVTPQQPQRRHWCDANVLQPVCHLITNTAGLADSPSSAPGQTKEHFHMILEQQRATDAWVVQVLQHETTAYTMSAQQLLEWADDLDKQASVESIRAQRGFNEAGVWEKKETTTKDQLAALEQDIERNRRTVTILMVQARRHARLAFEMGLSALCIAVGIFALLSVVVIAGCVASNALGQCMILDDRQKFLRRLLIAWVVVGVVNDNSNLALEFTSPQFVAERAVWIASLASLIGLFQAFILHNIFDPNLSVPRHMQIMLLDWTKFTAVSILHVLTGWLAFYGVVPTEAYHVLLHWRTQLGLVAFYIILMFVEPPEGITDEPTTILTGDSESTPLHSPVTTGPRKYGGDDSTVVYVGSFSADESTSAAFSTAAHAGWLCSLDALLLVCLARVFRVAYPCVQIHPFGAGVALSICLCTCTAISCRYLLNNNVDDRLPRTIVV